MIPSPVLVSGSNIITELVKQLIYVMRSPGRVVHLLSTVLNCLQANNHRAEEDRHLFGLQSSLVCVYNSPCPSVMYSVLAIVPQLTVS
jgi:hypothetical protein